MKQYDIIYKRTSTGKVQVWSAEVEGDKYRTISGQQDGKKTTSAWTVCLPKNTGRSNATTGEEQAHAEVEATYAKKLAREYRRDIADIDKKYYTKPMKSVKWKDVKARPKLGTKIGVQPKLDGMRALTSAAGAKSQDGKIIPGFRHIFAAMTGTDLFIDHPELEVDGEGYNHTHAERFEDLMSALKDASVTPEEDAEIKKLVQYHLYDIPSSKKPYAVFNDAGVLVDGRYYDLWQIYYKYLAQFGDMFQMTPMVEGVMDADGAFVDEVTERFLDDKYEGAMVRILNSLYESKTSKGLIKVKPMLDEEFEILDIEEGKGNWAGVAKRIWVRLPNGNKCKATPKGSKEYCRDLLVNKAKYIGDMGTVTFLRYTEDGMLYLPIFKGVRWDYVAAPIPDIDEPGE